MSELAKPLQPSGWKIPRWGSWVPSWVRDRHMFFFWDLLFTFAALSHLFSEHVSFSEPKIASINRTYLPNKKMHRTIQKKTIDALLPQSFPRFASARIDAKPCFWRSNSDSSISFKGRNRWHLLVKSYYTHVTCHICQWNVCVYFFDGGINTSR